VAGARPEGGGTWCKGSSQRESEESGANGRHQDEVTTLMQPTAQVGRYPV